MALALLSTPAYAWERADTNRELAWQAIHLADWAQTLQIEDDPDLYETNPFIGEDADRGRVNTWMAGTAIAHYLISRKLSPRKRRIWQWATIITAGAFVQNNHRLGLEIKF